MAACVILSIATFRFLYNAVPFLASLAIGAILAFGTVILLRVLSRKRVMLRGVALKKQGKLYTGCIDCHKQAAETDYLFSEDVLEAAKE